MPAVHYWFSGSALFLAVSFAFGLVVGFIGIKDVISLKLFYILLVIALLLTGWAWYSAASDAAESARLKGSLDTIAKAINAAPNSSAQQLADEILRRLPAADWHLTDAQKQAMGTAMESVPAASRFAAEVHFLPSSNPSRMFGADVTALFQANKWNASGTNDFSVNPDLKGIYIGISPEITKDADIPESAKVLATIFRAAGINVPLSHFTAMEKTKAVIIVGAPPP